MAKYVTVFMYNMYNIKLILRGCNVFFKEKLQLKRNVSADKKGFYIVE